jgi:hypothetical protein
VGSKDVVGNTALEHRGRNSGPVEAEQHFIQTVVKHRYGVMKGTGVPAELCDQAHRLGESVFEGD